MIPEDLQIAVDAIVPPGTTHVGFVATNIDGEVLVTTFKQPLHGVSSTFPKMRVQPDSTASRTLMSCIGGSLNKSPASLYPLHNTWVTPNSNSYYFVGLVESSEKPESNYLADFHWMTPEIAARHFESSPAASKQRDLAVLATAMKQCASPHRRVLLMLQELHRMGFQRLRSPAYDYPLAWRCPIVPAAWTHKQSGASKKKPSHHGGTFDDPMLHASHLFGQRLLHHTYSSSSQQRPFGWEDVAFASPRELALRFIRDHSQIALGGLGADPEYVEWFDRMLEMTHPNGIITAFYADDYGCFPEKGISNVLHTHFTRVEFVPLPPPGLATPGEFDQMLERLQKQTGS